MKMILRLPIVFVWVLYASTLLVMSYSISPQVKAEAAKCYLYEWQSDDPSYLPMECDTLLQNHPDAVLEEDKCYKSATAGFGWSPPEEFSCTETGSTPPKCYRSEYVTVPAHSDEPERQQMIVRNEFCDDPNYIAAVAGAGVPNIQSGTCYLLVYDQSGVVVRVDQSTIQGTCDAMDRAVEASDILIDAIDNYNEAVINATFTGPAGPSVTALPKSVADDTKVQAVMSFVFALAGAVALLMVAIGGFKYTTSHGEPQAVAKAKNTIMYALIGLVVVVLANFGVAYLINAIS